LEEIPKRPLPRAERQRFLNMIMAKTFSGEITPHEGRTLTKALR
jgi:hypothetical protein